MRGSSRPRRGRRAAAALALALLIGILAPSLLSASGEGVAGGEKPPDPAPADAGEGGEDAVREGEGLDDDAIEDPGGAVETAPGGADPSAAPPPGHEPDRGATAGDREPAGGEASEPEGERRGSRKSRPGPTARASGSSGVDIRDFAYSPDAITVRVGESVRWTNLDREPHNAEAFDGSFSTRWLERGESASVTFSRAGSFRYFCAIHPPSEPRWSGFTGTVTVLAAGDAPAEPGAAGDPPRAGEEIGAADRTEGGPADGATGAGSGLPATGLGLLPLIGLGLGLLSTGALMRRSRWTG